jgi:hypothetical protein
MGDMPGALLSLAMVEIEHQYGYDALQSDSALSIA